MNWKSVKGEKEVEEVYGKPIEFEKEDGNIKSVTITAENGKKLRFANSGYGYGVSVFVPAPPKMVDKYKLSGTINELPIQDEFLEDAYEAEKRKQYWERKFNALSEDEVKLSIDKVQVPEEE